MARLVLERARDWLADDPDPITRAEMGDLVDRAEAGSTTAVAELDERFGSPLGFGTAGLRGRLGAGPARMNLATVIRCAAALAEWMLDAEPEATTRGVVIGCDARHRSADFALASAEVFAAHGLRALLMPGVVPTPVLAFAVRHLGAAGGVMVTASHNPPDDNGYKVYDGSGRQIVSPVDEVVASKMAAIERVTAVPRCGPDDPDIVRLDASVVDAYVEAAASSALLPQAREVVAAYTAMHGVGAGVFRRTVAAAGFPPVVEVESQVEPDPSFPTVAFPNPEEPGALDAGITLAASIEADVLLAHDPDADRLGVAVPRRGSAPSDPQGWTSLSGDQIGVLIADHLLRHAEMGPDRVLATTVVSSRLLSSMAAQYSMPFATTLTGFKWLSRSPQAGQRLGFAYEEALGYCIGDMVLDKDGITAGLVFMELVAELRSDGRCVFDVLDDLERRHGVHHTTQWTARVGGARWLAKIEAAMADLRSEPPVSWGGRSVSEVVDFADGEAVTGLPANNTVVHLLEGGRVVVRPSGTEPKLKCYVEVVEAVAGDVDSARVAAASAADAILGELASRFASLVD